MRHTGGRLHYEPLPLDVEKAQKWRGSRDLVALPFEHCPDCGAELHESSSAQLPLLRHGGHGEVQQNRVVSCSCGYVRHASRTSENPRGLL